MKRILLLSALFLTAAMATFAQESGNSVIQIKGTIVEKLEGTFSATFQSTPIQDVFRIIAQETALNMMVSPKVSQTVTAKFKDVPIKDAFLAILSANELYYLEQGSIVKVMTQPEYRAEVQRAYVTTKTYEASIIDLKNLATVLKPLLTPGIGNFSIDAQSSKVIISDMKDVFPKIDLLFNQLSSLPKMVEIETRIVEIKLNDKTETGINWSAVYKNLSPQYLTPLQITAGQTRGSGLNGFTLSVPIWADDSGSAIDAVVGMLGDNNKVETVSQPRIMAVNREKSSILIGVKNPYVKSTTKETSSSTTTSQVDFVDTGVKLDIEPVITPENEVRMSIRASLSSASYIKVNAAGDLSPQITTTEVSCFSVAKHGQTLIIGGLIETYTNSQITGVPILKDIPILNFFFASTTTTLNKKELVIFLTPRITDGGKSNLSLKTASIPAIMAAGINTNQVPAEVPAPEVVPASSQADQSAAPAYKSTSGVRR